MKKKVLFVIGGFSAGGAERSMVNQLNAFDVDRYDVYIYALNPAGIFSSLVPADMTLIPISVGMEALHHRSYDVKFFAKHPVLWIKKLVRTFMANSNSRGYDINQKIWEYWKNDIPDLEMDFDAAVGHMEGIPNYFVIDKVRAQNKILWIHSQYEKLGYNIEFDRTYFSKASSVVTISPTCVDSLRHSFPGLANFCILPNITSSSFIKKMASEPLKDGEFVQSQYSILSIGRLVPLKNFPLAISVAKMLKDAKFDFEWLIIGDGPERKSLQEQIDQLDLRDIVKLVGLQSNPYKYIARSDLFVHTSTYEGKSMVIEEAKMLNKVVVSTNYDTVGDVINDGVDGLVSEMNPESLFNVVVKALTGQKIRAQIVSNLQNCPKGNEEEINNYYSVYGL